MSSVFVCLIKRRVNNMQLTEKTTINKYRLIDILLYTM